LLWKVRAHLPGAGISVPLCHDFVELKASDSWVFLVAIRYGMYIVDAELAGLFPSAEVDPAIS